LTLPVRAGERIVDAPLALVPADAAATGSTPTDGPSPDGAPPDGAPAVPAVPAGVPTSGTVDVPLEVGR
jgi:hypothetical protein